MQYSDLITFRTYTQRLQSLVLHQELFQETFAAERWLNQVFYRSPEWKKIRDEVIIRDRGCDLAIPGLEILDRVIIHHISPITIDDINHRSSKLIDLENLICVSYDTHRKIHYGYREVSDVWQPRMPNDTCPWRT